jgi:hypothetical protein
MRRMSIAFLLGVLAVLWSTTVGAAPPEPETASISTMLLELDGAVVGPLVACRVNIQDFSYVASNKRLSKTIDNLQYPKITFQIDASMGKPMYDWIKASVSGGGGGGGGARKSGAIIMANFNYKELARISFQNALITEVGMPKLDAASSAPGVITVTIQPESTSRTFPSKPNQLSKPKQKAWLCSNFRLDLGGLRLSDDALGCTQPPMINPTYESPSAQVASVIFNPREYSLFAEWQQALYCSGLPPESNERACTVTYLGPDGATLFTTSFISSGLFKLIPNTDPAGEVVSYTALLYVGGGATFDASEQVP